MSEECFPRGRPALTPKTKVKKTKRHIDEKVKEDVLFGERSHKTDKREEGKGHQRKLDDDDASNVLKVHKVKDEDALLKDWDGGKVDFLRPSRMQDGMLVLGCIQEIHELELVIGLPHCNKGLVQANNISRVYTAQIQRHLEGSGDEGLVPLTDMFHLGQLIVCSVLSIVKNAVQLTLAPSVVNKYLNRANIFPGQVIVGAVKSEEDHGYTIDIGRDNINAFVPSGETGGGNLLPGAVVRCVVMDVRGEGSILLLSQDEKKISKAMLKSSQGISLDLLQPGMVGSFIPKHKLDIGVIGKFLDFDASLCALNGDTKDMFILDTENDDFSQEPKKSRRKGKKNPETDDAIDTDVGKKKKKSDGAVKACILFVNPLSKHVSIGTRPIFFKKEAMQQAFNELTGSFPHGYKCNVTIDKHIKGLGALMHIDGEENITAFCLSQQLSDSKTEDLIGTYRKDRTYTARVLQSVSIDGVVLVSLKKSIVESEFFTYDSIAVGSIVDCYIKTVQDNALFVVLGKDPSAPLRGFVHKMHMADVGLQHPEKKFAPGDVISCKVLSVDKKHGKVNLTHKKTLMKSKLPTITSYDQLTPGLIVHGYITSIKATGTHVNFYENVFGYVPNCELAVEYVENPEKMFYVGQVMKCRVLSCDAEAERARLSFILKPKPKNDTQHDLEIFKTVKVVKKAPDGLIVTTLGESANSKHPAFLSTMHLSDFPSLAQTWHHLLKPGDTLENCMVICNRKPLKLTRKRSIVTSLNMDDDDTKCVTTFSDLKENLCVPGFVRYTTEYGVFVQLRGGLVGLCPKSKMADRYLSSTDRYYQEGQSVIGNVVEIDHEKKRFIISLKPSDSPYDSNSAMRSYLDEKKKIMAFSSLSWPETYTIGSKVPVEVNGEENDDGSLVCTNTSFGEFSAKLIDVPTDADKSGCMNATILHVDVTGKQIVLSAEAALITSGKKVKKTANKKATVKHVDADVATVVAADRDRSLVAIMLTRTHPNQPIHDDLLPLKSGEKIDVTCFEYTDGLLVVSEKAGNQSATDKSQKKTDRRQRNESESSDISLKGETNFGNLHVGQEVEGVIRSVKKTYLLVRFKESEMEGGYRGNPVTGRLHISEMFENPQAGLVRMKEYQPWNKIKSRVIGFRDVRTQQFLAITKRSAVRCVPELSLRPHHEETTVADLEVGQTVVAYSTKYCDKKQEIEVEITPSLKGFIPLMLASTNPAKTLKTVKRTTVCVAFHCVVTKVFKWSVALASKGAIVDRETQKDVLEVKENCICNAKVLKIFPTNMILALAHRCSGKVCATDSSDDYSDYPFEKYKVGQFVRCVVVACPTNSSLVLSQRQSRFLPENSECEIKDNEISNAKQLKVGQIVRGYIKNFSKLGVFVALSRNLTGRVDVKKMSKYFIHDIDIVLEIFKEGRVVQCKILEISPIEEKITLSMLESDTGCPDLVPEALAFPPRHGKEKAEKRKPVGTLVDKVSLTKKKKLKLEQKAVKHLKKEKPKVIEDRDSGLDEDLQTDTLEDSITSSHLKVITHDANEEDPGFSWETPVPNRKSRTAREDFDSEDDDEEEEEDVTQEVPKKKSKMEKALELAREEAELRRKEELAASDNMPQTAQDWDKLVLASPQNSMYWVSYMVFHLRSTEVERARVVAERAIKTIDFHEELEKWNIWAALLNLENRFGSEESLQDTMQRAKQHNDPLKVSTHMLSIFEKSGKFEQAQQLCEKMLRKFRQNKTVWMLYITHLMQQGKRDEANEVMKRSLQSLQKSSHLDIISKVGQLEYKFGDPEQGRVIFENALSNYPKRADIWSIYIDMLVKAGKIDEAREVYERVVTLNMSTKKMRTFFKRFIEFETKYGTDDSVAEVKRKALDFVESKTNKLME